MALSTNYKRIGRKDNIITGIRLRLSKQGKTLEEILEETKSYYKKTVLELLSIYQSIK